MDALRSRATLGNNQSRHRRASIVVDAVMETRARAVTKTRASSASSASASSAALPELHVLRVSQVDAKRLDEELLEILHDQLVRCVDALTLCATSACGSGDDVNDSMSSRRRARTTFASRERTKLFLDAATFACTTMRNAPTPGQELMNLRFRDERRAERDEEFRRTAKTGVEGDGLTVTQRLAYGAVKCAGAFAWNAWMAKMARERYDEAMDEDEDGRGVWKQRAWRWSRAAEDAHVVASFVNFCVFLRCGRYPTLVERFLGARLVYSRPSMARVVDFEYLNQQLAWRELSELVLFTLPYLYNSRVRSFVGAFGSSTSGEASTTSADGGRAGGRGRVVVQAHRCVACGCAEPVHPFVADPCGHPYCYYCLRARLLERPVDCPCVKCSRPVDRMRRLSLAPARNLK